MQSSINSSGISVVLVDSEIRDEVEVGSRLLNWSPRSSRCPFYVIVKRVELNVCVYIDCFAYED
jgi:hypothetical protein